MWLRLLAILPALAGLALWSAPALAESRTALVIGNSGYESVTALSNPANDAKAIAQVLNSAGFEVVMAFDLGRDLMRQVLKDFSARVAEKGEDSVALVYYAGHGLQVDGENFLVPVDARFEKESDVTEQAVRLADVMAALEAAPSKARIVILDACRNNPFSNLGDVAGKGLAIVDAPTGSIVAYSTAPGSEALDGTGTHSPYAAALMRTIKTPNLPIEQLFKKVRVLVNDNTSAAQTPWESSSLTIDFAFFASSSAAADPAAAAPPQVPVAELRTRSVNVAYEAAIAEDTPEYYEEFVRLYPNDPRCDHIRRALSRRLQMVAWQKATHANAPSDYAAFASRFGDSEFARAARRLQERPRLVALPNPPLGGIRIGPDFRRQNGPFGRPSQGQSPGRPGGPVIGIGTPGGPGTGRPTGPVFGAPGSVVNNPAGQVGGKPVDPNAGKLPAGQVGGKPVDPNFGKLPAGQVVSKPVDPNAGKLPVGQVGGKPVDPNAGKLPVGQVGGKPVDPNFGKLPAGQVGGKPVDPNFGKLPAGQVVSKPVDPNAGKLPAGQVGGKPVDPNFGKLPAGQVVSKPVDVNAGKSQGQVIGNTNAGKLGTPVVGKPVTNPVVTTTPVTTSVRPVGTGIRQSNSTTTTSVNSATRLQANTTTVVKPTGSSTPVVQRTSTTAVQGSQIRRRTTTTTTTTNSNTPSNANNPGTTIRR